MGQLFAMSRAHDEKFQILCACSAQSPDMLPKRTPSTDERAAKRAAMQAAIEAQFREAEQQ